MFVYLVRYLLSKNSVGYSSDLTSGGSVPRIDLRTISRADLPYCRNGGREGERGRERGREGGREGERGEVYSLLPSMLATTYFGINVIFAEIPGLCSSAVAMGECPQALQPLGHNGGKPVFS